MLTYSLYHPLSQFVTSPGPWPKSDQDGLASSACPGTCRASAFLLHSWLLLIYLLGFLCGP